MAEHNAVMKVSNLYISQVKRKCGTEVGKNYNFDAAVALNQFLLTTTGISIIIGRDSLREYTEHRKISDWKQKSLCPD